MGAETNGDGGPAGAFVVPAEQVSVGWLRLPDGTLSATVTFSDQLGSRTHLLDATPARTVGGELVRLAGFLRVGLEPPPADQVPR